MRSLTGGISDRISRALSQRLYLVHRKETSVKGSLQHEFAVLGSTGNVYQVRISKHPFCSCPDHSKGNVCKHILFVFLKVVPYPILHPLPSLFPPHSHPKHHPQILFPRSSESRATPTSPTRDASSKQNSKKPSTVQEVAVSRKPRRRFLRNTPK